MDYIINYGDGESMICDFVGENMAQRRRLYRCYLTILGKSEENISKTRQNVLKMIALAMSEQEAQEQNEKIEDALRRRMKGYADAFTNLKARKEDDDLQKIQDAVEELVEEYEDYDFGKEMTVEINGNRFTFDPSTFDVEKHKESLGKLGEESKENAWRVEVDDNGEVVLHS